MLGRGPRDSEQEAREAIATARSYSEAMLRLGVRPAGGNHATLRKYADVCGISTDHFDRSGTRPPWREALPLTEVLVEASTYQRRSLKRRLFAEGIKQRECELCG